MKIDWNFKNFRDLSVSELYEILNIRQRVFIVEQNCNYLDADNYDQFSHHLTASHNGKIIAYLRVVDKGFIYPHVSFGRILVEYKYRGLGIGKKIMTKALEKFDNKTTIIMSAQLYLVKFYQEFNFYQIGKEYLEDNILHVKMVRNG
tara:strand:+ start:1078 stop:1518 length:441 start_codon:yes stop_codon:yes gene_type:complete